MVSVKENSPSSDHVTVSDFLGALNSQLKNFKARIIGEVCNLKLYPGRSYMYFSVKDKDGQGMLNCFMWKRNYDLCGVDLEDGMEVVIYGFTKVYEPNGSLSFQTETVELVGEGALKKAYEKLKIKLEAEGLLSESRKKTIPEYPSRIGIVTSRDGAVLSDFTSNIGSFGYELLFVSSRVEGQIAVTELLAAVSTLREKKIDLLVIMRGGGSLESFQAFNNEMLVRAIAEFPVPVIAGIGHDKDICLVSLVADQMVSTPTAVAQLLNRSWDQALGEVRLAERDIMNAFSLIFQRFEDMRNMFNVGIKKIEHRILSLTEEVVSSEKQLNAFNPERQLKLGYSIVRLDGKIVHSIEKIKVGDSLEIKTHDGGLKTEVTNILIA